MLKVLEPEPWRRNGHFETAQKELKKTETMTQFDHEIHSSNASRHLREMKGAIQMKLYEKAIKQQEQLKKQAKEQQDQSIRKCMIFAVIVGIVVGLYNLQASRSNQQGISENQLSIDSLDKCGIDYHVVSGKCEACPIGTQALVQHSISDGDTTCTGNLCGS